MNPKESWATDEHGLTRIENKMLIRVHPCLSVANWLFRLALADARGSDRSRDREGAVCR
jgi:hypothetical protein